MNHIELIQLQAKLVFGNKAKAEVTSDAGSLTDSRDSQFSGCGRLARRHQRTLGGSSLAIIKPVISALKCAERMHIIFSVRFKNTTKNPDTDGWDSSKN